MTDSKSALFYVAMTIAMTAVAAVYALLLHPLSPDLAVLTIVLPTAVMATMWLVIWLVVRISYKREIPLDPAYAAYFGRSLSVYAIWIAAIFAYFYLYMPITGSAGMSDESYHRVLLIASGLVLAGLGNIAPKLPYQQQSRWLEVGPERSYRLNRFSGWIMVTIGAVEIALGLVFPLTTPQFLAVALGGFVLILVPYFWLQRRFRSAYRRELGEV